LAVLARSGGWELHFWRGVRVRRDWIRLGEALDPHLVLTWPHDEQRRALAEIAGGWHRVLEKVTNAHHPSGRRRFGGHVARMRSVRTWLPRNL